MSSLFELLMIVCFGVSWPINIHKAWKARTTKGISVQFYFLIFVGYICGITSKVVKICNHDYSTPWYVWFFYILNLIIVGIGIGVWFRNRRLDRMQEAEAVSASTEE